MKSAKQKTPQPGDFLKFDMDNQRIIIEIKQICDANMHEYYFFIHENTRPDGGEDAGSFVEGTHLQMTLNGKNWYHDHSFKNKLKARKALGL